MRILKIIPIVFFSLCSNALAISKDLPKNSTIEQDKKDMTNIKESAQNPIRTLTITNPSIDKTKNRENSTSLMYSDDELDKIQEATEAYKNNQPLIIENQEVAEEKVAAREDNAKSYIYLGSILYNSPRSWSVWINNKKISYDDNRPDNQLYIKSIDESKVNIVWTMSISTWKILTNKKSDEGAPINSSNQVEISFTLGFNQTYTLKGGKIIEGRIATKLSNIVNNKLSSPNSNPTNY